MTVRVTGRVQGVWFRGWTKAEADRRGLTGWVRNEPDGSVVACIRGPESEVAGMLAALWQGPPSARVDSVVTEATGPQPRESEPVGFSIRR